MPGSIIQKIKYEVTELPANRKHFAVVTEHDRYLDEMYRAIFSNLSQLNVESAKFDQIFVPNQDVIKFTLTEAIKNSIDAFASEAYDESGTLKKGFNQSFKLEFVAKVRGDKLSFVIKDNGCGHRNQVIGEKFTANGLEIQDKRLGQGYYGGLGEGATRSAGYLASAGAKLQFKNRKKGGAALYIEVDLHYQVKILIAEINARIRSLDHIYVWNGRKKAAQLRQALTSAIANLEKKKASGIIINAENFLDFREGSKPSLQNALNLRRHQIFDKYIKPHIKSDHPIYTTRSGHNIAPNDEVVKRQKLG